MRQRSRVCRSLPVGDDQRPVGGPKHLIGHDIGMGVAEPSRRLSRDEEIERLVGEDADLRVEQRHVDLAARAR